MIFINCNYGQKIPGQSQYEMAVDLFNSKEYEDGKMILDIAIGKNNVDAMKYKGDLYYQGIAYEKNYLESNTWYQKAASLGDYEAMTKIGNLYSNGLIEGKTSKDAIEYFISLYEIGHFNSAALIGYFYAEGIGITENMETAIEWLQKGEQLGDIRSKFLLGKYSLNDSQKESLDLIITSCDSNLSDACAYLGYIYFKGYFVKQDFNLALNYLEKAIQDNNSAAYFHKAEMMLAYVIEGSKKEALQLVEQSLKAGYSKKDCDLLRLQIYGEMTD